MTIYEDYFQHTASHILQHGNKTIVLLQNGKFYEIFNLKIKDPTQKLSTKLLKLHQPPHYPLLNQQYSHINHVSQICNLAISNRHQFENHDVLMAGIPTQQLDKYLEILVKHGYTVPVYNQEYDGKNPPRNLKCIYSASTFFQQNETNTNLTNSVVCSWIELNKKQDKINIAIAIIDTTTSQSTISEYLHDYHHQPTTYDDIQRTISIQQPTEFILIGNMPSHTLNDIIQFINVNPAYSHIHSSIPNDPLYNQHIIQCSKQTYQLQLIQQSFQNINHLDFMQNYLSISPLATQAFCFLLHFFQTHNQRLIHHIQQPTFNQQQLVLANNCLEQLNITSQNQQNLTSLLNLCITHIGKREFHHLLLHPTTNINNLNQSYSITQHLLNLTHNSNPLHHTIRNLLSNIRDIEQFNLKANIQKLTPKDFYILHQNINICNQIYLLFQNNLTLSSFINQNINLPQTNQNPNEILNHMFKQLLSINSFIQQFLNLNLCINETKQNIHTNIFQPGNYNELDQKYEMLLNADNKINAIHLYLNSLVSKNERKKLNNDLTLIKKNITEKTPMNLSLTQRRANILKLEIEKIIKTNHIVNIQYHNHLSQPQTSIPLDLSLFKYQPKTHTKNDSDLNIFHPELDILARGLFDAQETMQETIQTTFLNLSQLFIKQYLPHIKQLILFIRTIDVLQCKAHITQKFNLTQPSITPSKQSFLIIEKLRHCIVENQLHNELYVANNISLGYNPNPSNTLLQIDKQGYLLYGTNAVGKTCLIKAIGIAVIMAQAGLFVPCSSMTFSPYEQIFTRIVNRDDLFKGLSTFAMEMAELRTILNMCGPKSLILGDELCSGTENMSAISIFIAGIQTIHHAQSSYIFATHFHELQHTPEIKAIPQLGMKHMQVHYNSQTKLLEYNRTLQDGCGEAMYGLEVCRSLSMPIQFLENALNIRNNLPQSASLTPPVLQQKTSRYSKKKLLGICQLCLRNKATETHHIHPQKNANQNGFISNLNSTFHKNHPANLQTLCDQCHLKIHQNNTQNSP